MTDVAVLNSTENVQVGWWTSIMEQQGYSTFAIVSTCLIAILSYLGLKSIAKEAPTTLKTSKASLGQMLHRSCDGFMYVFEIAKHKIQVVVFWFRNLFNFDERSLKKRHAECVRLLNEGGKAFPGQDLRGIDLGGCDLTGVSFFGANLQGANLRNCTLDGTVFTEANLSGADLRGMRWGTARSLMCNAKLYWSKIDMLNNVDLTDAAIYGTGTINLNRCILERTTLSGFYINLHEYVTMINVKLHNSVIKQSQRATGCTFSQMNLNGSTFKGLSYCKFVDIDCSATFEKLEKCEFVDIDCSEVISTGGKSCKFINVNGWLTVKDGCFNDCRFTSCKLRGELVCSKNKCSYFTNCDLEHLNMRVAGYHVIFESSIIPRKIEFEGGGSIRANDCHLKGLMIQSPPKFTFINCEGIVYIPNDFTWDRDFSKQSNRLKVVTSVDIQWKR